MENMKLGGRNLRLFGEGFENKPLQLLGCLVSRNEDQDIACIMRLGLQDVYRGQSRLMEDELSRLRIDDMVDCWFIFDSSNLDLFDRNFCFLEKT